MEIFKLRNLALGCFAFLISIYISNVLNNLIRFIIIAIAFALFITFLIIYVLHKNDKILKIIIRYTPLVLGIILAFFITVFTFGNDEKIEAYFDDDYHETILEIKEIRQEESYFSSYVAEIQSIDGKDYKTKIYLNTDGGFLKEGDVIRADIRYSELIYTSFDDKESIFTKGIRALGNCQGKYEIVSHNKNKINIALEKIRTFLKEQLSYGVNDETYEIICALLLGDKSSLPANVTRDFSRIGISHILALSGMHVALIVTLIGFMLSVAHIPQKFKILILILSTLFFVLLTGMSPSAMRAGIMVIIFHLLLILRHDTDTITSLFLSVSIICLFSPYSVFSLSLILSFVALLALIASGKFIYSIKFLRRLRPRPLRYAVFTIISTSAVITFTLPIMFLYFGTVSLISPLMNVIIVPVFTVILYLSPFIAAFAKVTFIRVPLGFILEKLVHFALFIIHKVANLKYVVIPISGVIETIAITLLVMSVFLVLIISRKRVKFAIFGILLSVTIFTSGVIFNYAKRFSETAFSVDSYDAISDFIIMECDNKFTVISIGSNSRLYNAYYISKEFEYTEIENLVIFEYDKYLVKYLDLVSNYTYLRNLYLIKPADDDEKKIFEEVQNIANDKNINIRFIENKMNFGEISLEVSIKSLPRSTKSIVCISALANNSRFTYLGASAYELLDDVAENMAYVSDIVVFGSYGPNYHVYYNYEVPYLDYCVFLGKSKNYVKDDFKNSVLEKEIIHTDKPIRFIFK